MPFPDFTRDPMPAAANEWRKRHGFFYRMPIEYLHSGDHFVAYVEKASNAARAPYSRIRHGVKQWRYGIADMDGHAVSRDYGLQSERGIKEEGRYHQLRGMIAFPEANYINVQYADETYNRGPQPDAGKPNFSKSRRVNHTIYACEVSHGKVYVRQDVYDRYLLLDKPWERSQPLPIYNLSIVQEDTMPTNQTIRKTISEGDAVQIVVKGTATGWQYQGGIEIKVADSTYVVVHAPVLEQQQNVTLSVERGPLPTVTGSVLEHIETGDKYILMGGADGTAQVWYHVGQNYSLSAPSIKALWDSGMVKSSTTP